MGRYEVAHGECIHIAFHNLGSSPVYLTVFNLKQNWGITQIYPLEAGLFEEVLPGQERMLHFTMTIPSPYLDEGQTEVIDDLKAIVTLRPTSLKSLELKSIMPGSPALSQDAHRGADLDDLLEALRRPSRDTKSSTGLWRAHDIVIRTLVPRNNVEIHTKELPTESKMSGLQSLSTELADPDELLTKYVEWYKERGPQRAKSLDNALAALRRELHDLDNVKEMKDADWIRMGIEIGLGRCLSRQVQDFQNFERTKSGREGLAV